MNFINVPTLIKIYLIYTLPRSLPTLENFGAVLGLKKIHCHKSRSGKGKVDKSKKLFYVTETCQKKVTHETYTYEEFIELLYKKQIDSLDFEDT